MKFNVLPLSVAAALALSACGGGSSNAPGGATPGQTQARQASAQPITGPALTGTASIDNLTSLPPGLSLVTRLLDTTDAASLPVVVAESVQPAPNVLPLSFAIGYDPATISQERRYGVQVAVQAETLVLYGTASPIPALTNGAPNKGLKASLVRGGQPAADVPPGEQAKADFATLSDNIGALRRIQGERLEADVAVGWDAFVEDSGQIRMAREQVDFGDAGSAQFRYAYKGGKPWVVERIQGRVTTLIGWNESGDLILNEKGGDQADETDAAALFERAQSLYGLAAAKR
ncbi:YbaY family lipoprotein [Xanthomonadaceae bacterium JHOS43]|nr:YbaY family lipoprotein [Xanthomonadaceae bacterium JHOS43]